MTNKIVTAQADTFKPVEGFICTIDMSTDDGRDKMLNALNGAAPLTRIPVGTEFDVVDVITMPGERKSRETGAVNTCQNTYLLVRMDDGSVKPFVTQSDGIKRSINIIMTAYPSCHKSNTDCLTMAVKEENLANGNVTKSLVLL